MRVCMPLLQGCAMYNVQVSDSLKTRPVDKRLMLLDLLEPFSFGARMFASWNLFFCGRNAFAA